MRRFLVVFGLGLALLFVVFALAGHDQALSQHAAQAAPTTYRVMP